MKKFVKVGLIFSYILVFMIQSCSTDESTEEIENLTKNDYALKAIKSWGFPEDMIVDKGTYYLVDEDIIFYKNQKYPLLENPDSEIVSKQRRHNIFVSINNINVYINPGMDANWRNASITAINRWNAINQISLNLIITTNPSNAHIQILYDSMDSSINLAPNVFGLADLPIAGGLPGRRVWINPDFDSNTFCFRPINQNMRIANVQHELGHNLGLRHTNQSFGFHIPGTPTTDFQSVMNGGQACTINDFSNGDITAIEFLFPIPPPRLSPTIIYFDARDGYTNNSQLMRVTGSGEVTITVDGASGIMFRENSSEALKTSLTLTAPATFQLVAFELFRPDLGNRQSFVRLRQNNATTSTCVVHQLGPNN